MCSIGDQGDVGWVGSVIKVGCVNGVSLQFSGVDVDVATVGGGIRLYVEVGVVIVDPEFGLIVNEVCD